jgi:hypothetical protein
MELLLAGRDGCACLECLGSVERRENVSWSGCGAAPISARHYSPPWAIAIKMFLMQLRSLV